MDRETLGHHESTVNQGALTAPSIEHSDTGHLDRQILRLSSGGSPVGTRFSSLVRVDFRYAGTPANNGSRKRRPTGREHFRRSMGYLVNQSGALTAVAGPGSLVAEFQTPGKAISFARSALQVGSAHGFETRAAADVHVINGNEPAYPREAMEWLARSIARVPGGQLGVSEMLYGLVLGIDGNWLLIDGAGLVVDGSPRTMRSAVAPLPTRTRRTVPALSQREREVATLLARGLSNRDVATALRIATSTVERHVSNLFGKLDVRSRVDIAVLAASGRLIFGS